jgi:hypothetical protein
MSMAYFCTPLLITSELSLTNDIIGLCLTESEWRCIGKFLLSLAYNLQNPPANGKRGLVIEEISQTLLTNNQ